MKNRTFEATVSVTDHPRIATFDERDQVPMRQRSYFSRTKGTSPATSRFSRTLVARANADGAATQMKRKPSPAGVLRPFRPRKVRRQKLRMLDEPGPDELLDDWMVSGPSVERASSD
jgi:hypothetical protein